MRFFFGAAGWARTADLLTASQVVNLQKIRLKKERKNLQGGTIMNDLTVFNRGGQLYTDSREVAKMVGKDHKHLLRDIDGYIGVLSQSPKLGPDNFFKKSSYKAGTGKTYPFQSLNVVCEIPVSLATLYADNPFCFISSSNISYIFSTPFTNRKILSKCY